MRVNEEKLSHLKAKHDYSEDGVYLILMLQKKKGIYEKVICDWFDYNSGTNFKWLLVRQYNPKCEVPKYTNYKLDNIQEEVKIVEKAKQRKDKVYASEK
ncbi:hypothetical protein FT637_24950 [Bacillus cereus]|uniref:DUF5513 family protein n=1 Tax=Bacillus cereus group TaxID=86661 RepID=UPI001879DE03|nr:DUF5513 family protein [Bacillus cereus]MBE7106137.1 hypothetical protein [Bacillus cereus]